MEELHALISDMWNFLWRLSHLSLATNTSFDADLGKRDSLCAAKIIRSSQVSSPLAIASFNASCSTITLVFKSSSNSSIETSTTLNPRWSFLVTSVSDVSSESASRIGDEPMSYLLVKSSIFNFWPGRKMPVIISERIDEYTWLVRDWDLVPC